MSGDVLLDIRGAHKVFHAGGFLRRGEHVRAVDGVDLQVRRGEIVSIVGESGSGKTTLARCILGLDSLTTGQILFDGADVAKARGGDRRRLRQVMQPVFQDTSGSLDPRWTVLRSVRESLDVGRVGSKSARNDTVVDLLRQVGLSPQFVNRRPHQLSGGQRQRVGIAAALAAQPQLLVADEPVTALDVSVQAQVLNLLHEIQRELGLTVLLIAHDLSVVAHISDRVAVMRQGQIVESGPTDSVFDEPTHPYTQTLIAAAPILDLDETQGEQGKGLQ